MVSGKKKYTPTSKVRSLLKAARFVGNLHGKIRKKFVHAKTTKYRHPMVEKAVGVTSATMKL